MIQLKLKPIGPGFKLIVMKMVRYEDLQIYFSMSWIFKITSENYPKFEPRKDIKTTTTMKVFLIKKNPFLEKDFIKGY